MIEIEKKFLLTGAQQIELLEGAKELGEKLVTDSYFDTDDHKLTLGDFWFRERDGAYELKAPLQSTAQSGSTANRYNEITDIDGIRQALGLPPADDFTAQLESAGIKKFVTCYTKRRSYEKQGFHVDIDSATFLGSDFEYSLAEIELLVDTESEATDAEDRIIAFARQFQLTTDAVILGKIGAYIQSRDPQHYKLLIEAKVFSA